MVVSETDCQKVRYKTQNPTVSFVLNYDILYTTKKIVEYVKDSKTMKKNIILKEWQK